MFSRSHTSENGTQSPIQQPTPATPAHQSAGSNNISADAGKDPFAPAATMTASTIGTDLTILGEKITIISQHQLQIDGDVRADINGKKVTIGPEGSVTGTITAEAVEIHGGLRGAIKAQNVILQSTAQVEGEVRHETLAIAEGAEFDGSVRRAKDPAEIKPNLDPSSLQNGAVTPANRSTPAT